MFTGIIDSTGIIKHIKRKSQNWLITISPQKENYLLDVKEGESIAVNGVCLTLTSKTKDYFETFVSSETLKITNLQFLKINEIVNLEKSLKLNDRLNGHLVLGHVDGIGTCKKITRIFDDYKLEIEIPQELLKYIVKKGSIAINGISLTIAEIKKNLIEIIIIPQTYNQTNVKYFKNNTKVNIEVDIIGKYIYRILNRD